MVANIVKLSKRVPFLYPPFSFSWEAEGVSAYEAPPSFASCYALALCLHSL